MTLQDAARHLRAWDNMLIFTHRRPDGDACGSAAALCAGLRVLGKTAYIARNPDMTVRYEPYVADYAAPKDWVSQKRIAVDTASGKQLPAAQHALVPDFDMLIDHHRGEGWAKLNLMSPESAACGEMIFDLLAELGVPLTKELALPLYLAVSTDTGCFRYSNTSPKTHRIAATLLETGIDFQAVNYEMFERKSAARIALEASAFQNMDISPGGGLAVIAVPLSLQEETKAVADDLDNISTLPRKIHGVKIGIALREESPGDWKVSIRTAAPYDASYLCSQFGGGGHLRAGGCQITGSRSDITARLKTAIQELYPDYDAL